MSDINYSVDPKEWISAVINARLNQLTLTENNSVVESVEEILGRPNEVMVKVKVDRNYGIDTSLGIKPYTKRYLYRNVKIVRKIAHQVANKLSHDGILRVYTATLPNNTLDVVTLLNNVYNLDIDPDDVHVIPVTKFGAVDITFKAKSYGYYGKFKVNVFPA